MVQSSARSLLTLLAAHKGEMIEDLREFVELESPSGDRAAAGAALDWVAAKLEAYHGRPAGGRVERAAGEAGRSHLTYRITPAVLAGGPAAGGSAREAADGQLLLLGHVDTVWPVGTIRQRPFRVEGDTAWGPGTYDMKGGVVLALWALRAMRELGLHSRRTVTFLLNADEETGSRSSRAAIEEEARRSAAALVLEPAMPNGDLKTWRKGVGLFHLEITGKAAHAGADPQKGANAIEELAVQIRRLHALTDHSVGTTVNVGVVGGGSRPNVVADRAWAEIDVRVLRSAEIGRIEPAILGLTASVPGTTVKVTGGIDRPPMERTQGALRLFERARELAAELGLAVGETGTGGASDGNLTAALGVPTLDGMGVVGDGAHAEKEFVDLRSLPVRAALVARMIETV